MADHHVYYHNEYCEVQRIALHDPPGALGQFSIVVPFPGHHGESLLAAPVEGVMSVALLCNRHRWELPLPFFGGNYPIVLMDNIY